MRSSASAEWLDLERDLPTTPGDVAVLRRLRYWPRVGPEEYLALLKAFEPPSWAALRARKGPRGDRPFDLLEGERPK